jgi:hypothetical protein
MGNSERGRGEYAHYMDLKLVAKILKYFCPASLIVVS